MVNSDFAMTIWRFWISDCKYVLLLVKVFAIDCSDAEFCARVWVCVCVRGTGSHHSRVYSPSEIILTVACVQIHTSIITVSVTRLCSPLGLKLIKLTWKLKLAIMERGVTFPMRLVVFGQSQCTGSVGQSEQTALVGRRDFVENEAFERGGA